MDQFVLLAEPWWVNLLIFVPPAIYFWWRNQPLAIPAAVLFYGAMFGIAFGFAEGAVVVYLRAAVGQLPGYGGTLADVARLSSALYQRATIQNELPQSLLAVEICREAATMFMLGGVALATVHGWRERCAMFLWTFALWDIVYYMGLYMTVGWPPSLVTADVLFLIPVPWLSQVWYPLLVSTLTLIAIAVSRRAL